MDAIPTGWLRLARAMRRKINCGWWLHVSATPLVVAAMVLLGPTLWARRHWPVQAGVWHGWAALAAVIGTAGVAWWLARRRFVDTGGALVRLESRLGLHNRLSAAAAGACAWPPVPERADHGIRWAPGQTLLPLVAAAVFFAAAWWVPIAAAAKRAAPDEPAAWRTTETELMELAREEAVDPESLEKTREQVEKLRTQDPEQWFSHATLEATDKLRESHLRAAAELRNNLRRVGQGMARMTAGEGILGAKTKAALQDQFKQAVEAMSNGAMKPNPKLLEQLRDIDPNQLGQLDRDRMEKMLQQLREDAEALGECGGGLGEDPAEGEGEGDGEGDGDGDGDQPGRGGVSRGPGTSDRLFGKERAGVDAQRPQALESADLSRAQPGEVLETTDAEHEIDRTSPALRSGGKAATEGGGGTTWRESLHPKEQEALKRFFE